MFFNEVLVGEDDTEAQAFWERIGLTRSTKTTSVKISEHLTEDEKALLTYEFGVNTSLSSFSTLKNQFTEPVYSGILFFRFKQVHLYNLENLVHKKKKMK